MPFEQLFLDDPISSPAMNLENQKAKIKSSSISCGVETTIAQYDKGDVHTVDPLMLQARPSAGTR